MGIRATPAEIAELAALAESRGGKVRGGQTPPVEPELPKSPVARGRHVRHEAGRMNKTEAAWAAELESRKAAGEVAGYWFESVKFRLADKTWYTPDFLVMLADGTMEVHEVKGRWEDDARVKWKVAAEQYPFLAFLAARRVKGKWEEERYRGA